jgi:hypothetical protein
MPSMQQAAWCSIVAAVMLLSPPYSCVAQAARPAPDISGVWWASSYSPQIMPSDGSPIPFTAAGRALEAENAQKWQQNPASDTAHSLCVPQGLPRVLTAPYPFQIYQSGGQVVFIHEANRAFRIVLMRADHADPRVWDPSYMGEGIGRWHGDVLVIDTRNFNAKTWLDDSALPHSDQLHTVERLRILQGGRELEDIVTIEDPMIYSKAWSIRLLFQHRPDVHIVTDWVCGEAHRDISGIKGAVSYR